MHKPINPASIKASPSYSHGIVVTGPTRWLAIAGQVGRDGNGTIPDGIEAQAEIAWANIAAVLQAADMKMTDLVEITVFLISRDDNASFDAIRAKWLAGAKPASTKLYVAGLADPRMLCEIRAVAAKHDV